MLIRREAAHDLDPIDAIHRAAFARPDTPDPVEARLVCDLRADLGWVPALSLVAEDPDGAVVGHVVCTVGAVGGRPALGLGPLGVLPEHQGHGVGAALMHAVLGAADALDHTVVVLLGHVDYYPRFGFVPAQTLGIMPTDPTWGAHFQARPLSAWSPAITGEFRYAAPFDAL
jgi:putative acetyltransferase